MFEESFVRISLRDGVVGPLVDFYTIDPIEMGKEFLNGMYLIGVAKALEEGERRVEVGNVVGLMLERRNSEGKEMLWIKFAVKVIPVEESEEEYILLYDCSLIYNISVFEIGKCSTNTSNITQSSIPLSTLISFSFLKNPSPSPSLSPLYLLSSH